MTGTAKAPRRSATAPSKKSAAKPADVENAALGLKPRKAVKAKVAPVPELEEVAELTAADLAVSQEVPKSPPAPVVAEPEAPKAVVEPAAVETPKPAAAPAVVSDVVEKAEDAVQKGKETMSDVLETTKKYTEEAKERFQSAFSEMSEKAKAGVEKSSKAFEEFSDLAKGNVEAIVESGKIATKGVEALGQGAAEYGRLSFEKASAAMKSLAAAKSPTEFFQLQSELMSSTFDSFAKESAKASEAMLKLAGDVVQPISTRVSVVTEKVRTLSA